MTTLERFSQFGEIEISNDPISGFKRLAILQGGLLWFPVCKQVILDLEIHYLDNNKNRLNLQRLPAYKKRLMADMNGRVDQDFNYIEKPKEIKNEQDEIINQEEIDAYNNAKAEYEVILSLALNTPTLQLCIQFIQLRDLQEYFNI